MPRMAADYDILAKAVIVGDSGVGKTCLLSSYIGGGSGCNSEYIATIGIDFKVDVMERQGKVVKLQLWDTAGQERFRTIGVAYYRGANAVLLVYDCSQKETFDHVVSWLDEIKKNSQAGIPIFLVANKCDLAASRAVSKEEGEAVAKSIGCFYAETSARTGTGVTSTFVKVVDSILETQAESLSAEQVERRTRLTETHVRNPSEQRTCLQRFKFLLGL